jgi:hypothetical protein
MNTYSIVLFSLLLSQMGYAQNSLRSEVLPQEVNTSTVSARLPFFGIRPEKLGTTYDYTMRSQGGGTNSPVDPTKLSARQSQNQTSLFNLRYAIAPKWAVRFSEAYIQSDMQALKNGQQLEVTNNGFGDTRAQGIYTIYQDFRHRLEVAGGFSLPTGAINATDPTGALLRPQMQLGSGTFDFIPSVSYAFTHKKWVVGNRLDSAIHTGMNSQGNRLGDDFGDSYWVSYDVFRFLEPTFTFNIRNRQKLISSNAKTSTVAAQGKVKSTDIGTPPAGPPGTQDQLNGPGTSFDGLASLRSQLPITKKFPLRASLEVGAPIFQGGTRGGNGLRTFWYAGGTLQAVF